MQLYIAYENILNASPLGGAPSYFNQTDASEYLNYDFVIYTGSQIIERYEITGASAFTNYAIIDITGNPSLSNVSFALAPSKHVKEAFFAKNPFERFLIQESDIQWPKFSGVTDILLYDGAAYDAFESAHLTRALSADTIGGSPQSNVLWEKLVPDGIKYLDNDDEILQKFVLTIAQTFDQIRLYQEQLSFAHTLGYSDYDHVPRDLVYHLAKLWGWDLSHDTKNNDLTSYSLALYDHYASGTSNVVHNLSAADINFERWRRIVSSLVRIWKSKGTRKAIQHVMNAYGVPLDLLVLDEYIDFIDDNYSTSTKQRKIETGVFVVTSTTHNYLWIDQDNGSDEIFATRSIVNTRFLDVGLSQVRAIYGDLYNWSKVTNQVVTNVNGTDIILSSNSISSLSDFEDFIINNFIPSDGSHRSAKNYPLLEELYTTYIKDSSNAYVYGDFSEFIDFIDENFMDIVTQLIPASSRLLSQGTIFENLPFHRQKYQWIENEIVKQPFNDEKVWDIPSIRGSIPFKTNVEIDSVDVLSSKQSKVASVVKSIEYNAEKKQQFNAFNDSVNIKSSIPTRVSGQLNSFDNIGNVIEQPQDIYELYTFTDGIVLDINSPYIDYELGGSSAYTAFSNTALIVTNNNKFDVSLSAYNMSTSGMNKITVELFRKLNEDDISKIRSSAYTIIQTIYEGSQFNIKSNNIGTYKLNSVEGLQVGDFLSATSAVDKYINNNLLITNVFPNNNIIVTSPPIGLDNLPVGSNGTTVGLKTLFNSGVVLYLIDAIETHKIPHDVIIRVLRFLYSLQSNINDIDIQNFSEFTKYLRELHYETNIPLLTLQSAFKNFASFSKSDIAGSLIVVTYLRDNPNFVLSLDKISILNTLISNLSSVTLRKVNNLFDWSSPVQSFTYDQLNQGDFVGWPSDNNLIGITDTNDRIISGSVTVGGLDSLFSNILIDKEEYFIRWNASAEVTSGFTGETIFSNVYSGRNMVESGWNNEQIYNNIKYFGNYFVYMLTTKEPLIESAPSNSGQTSTSTAFIEFNGVGDSNRLKVQFLDAGPAPAEVGVSGPGPSVPSVTETLDAYTALTPDHWATAMTVSVDVKPNADDRTSYAVQTTLSPLRWYWWRITNIKSKLTIFGYNLESETHSEPQLFATGKYKDIDSDQGEIAAVQSLPDQPSGSGHTLPPWSL